MRSPNAERVLERENPPLVTPDITQDTFPLDWLDQKIGREERRRAAVLFSSPVPAVGICSSEPFEQVLGEFWNAAEAIGHEQGADCVRCLEIHGSLCVWMAPSPSVFRKIAEAARALAALRCRGGAVSCAAAFGSLLISDYAADLSALSTRLTGRPAAEASAIHAKAEPGNVIATDWFLSLSSHVGGAPAAPGFDAPKSKLRHEAIATEATAIEAERRFIGFGRARRFLSVAAVVGVAFDLKTVAEVLSCSAQGLLPMVEHLQAAGVVERFSVAAFANGYRINDCILHDVAYNALPALVRIELHAKMADALARKAKHSGLDSLLAVSIATHFARAGKLHEAADWWRAAAMDAVLRSTPIEAIRFLKSAHSNLTALHVPQTDANWTEVCRLLGTQLATIKGNASSEVLSAYCGHLGGRFTPVSAVPAQSFDMTWGLLGCYLTRGELGKARDASRHLVKIADGAVASHFMMLAHRMAGLTELLLGNLDSAVFHLRSTIAGFDSARHADLRFQYGSDQLALAHTHLALAHALMAEQEVFQHHARVALRRAQTMQHAHTTAHVTSVLTLAYEIIGLRREASLMDLVATTTSSRHHYPYWHAWAGIVRAAMLIEAQPQRAIVDLKAAIKSYHDTGARQFLPFAYARLSRATHAAGMHGEARSHALAGLTYIRQDGVKLFEPDLLNMLAVCAEHGNYHFMAARYRRRAVARAKRMALRTYLQLVQQ